MKEDVRAAQVATEAWVPGMVSVVMPTRNRPQLLARALARVMAQDHPSIEVIIVDDGSSDECRVSNVSLRRQAAPGVRVLYVPDGSGAGMGPSQARNVAISQARGEFIAFCDDDDEWDSTRHLSAALAAFEQHPALDLYFCNQIATRNGEVEYDVWMPLMHHTVGAQRLSGGSPIRISKAEALCAPGDFAHLNTCVVRRSLLWRTGHFWADVRYVEDLDMFLRWVDAARDIVYNPHTATRHHIPNRALKASASTRLSLARKHATINQVARHLLRTCSTPEAVSYTKRLGLNACKNLVALHRQERHFGLAAIWAARALAWRCRL